MGQCRKRGGVLLQRAGAANGKKDKRKAGLPVRPEEDVNGLLGPSSAIGASGGYLGYGAIDLISFEDMSDLNGELDGFQIGAGVGFDIHLTETYTNEIHKYIWRNVLRVVKKKNGRLINAKVINWGVISGQPTRYILEVEYQMNRIKKTKRLITSGKFARKYEKERDIPIVVMEDTNKIFFEEEDWKQQNIVLIIVIIMIIPFLIPLMFCSFLEIMKVILVT